jgi:transposase
MRQAHKAGEKCFVDYSGKTPSYVDPQTGQRVSVELFVAVLGASNFTYAEATWSQKVQDFVLAHVHALAYFGGAPAMWVPDQLKSAVVVACRYEPGIQRTYAEFAAHYDSAVVPARPYKPRDKAKVEVAVLVVQRWILARLRNETFFSLESLNRRIRKLLDELNDRPMKKLGGISRRELFERVERTALRPLPSAAYEYADWQKKTLNTTTSRSTSIGTRRRTGWCIRKYGCGLRRKQSRFFTLASAWRHIGAARSRTSTRPIRRTCPKRTVVTPRVLMACCVGRSRSAPWRRRWCSG